MIRNILSLIAVSTVCVACNDIDSDDRYIEIPATPAPDPEVPDPEVPTVPRVVLLEEFTGQDCPNCPAAHEVMATLLGQYPDNLVAVSIHAGPQSMHIDDDGLGTDDGEEYADYFGIDKYPSAVIDYTSGLLTSDLWPAYIRRAVAEPSHTAIALEATYNDADATIDITTAVTTYEAVSGGFIQLWVVESGIRDYQTLIDGSATLGYMHNHVFRAAVNGLWGTDFAADADVTTTQTWSIDLDDAWDVDNISIVAFVRDSSGVLQAAQTHVTTQE